MIGVFSWASRRWANASARSSSERKSRPNMTYVIHLALINACQILARDMANPRLGLNPLIIERARVLVPKLVACGRRFHRMTDAEAEPLKGKLRKLAALRQVASERLLAARDLPRFTPLVLGMVRTFDDEYLSSCESCQAALHPVTHVCELCAIHSPSK